MPEQHQPSLTDHEYDGIQEYDNPLPGWWVYLFWASIFFAIPYVMWFHLGVGSSVHDRFESELAAHAQAVVDTFGKLEPTEETVFEFMDNDAAIIAMRGLFETNCAKCHLADGSGQVGPNLTDGSWKNVKTVMDIYTVLNEGIVANGMPAWEGKLLDTQVILLTSYVAAMGRDPITTAQGGKAPEGTLVDPWPPLPPSGMEDSGEPGS